MSVLYRFIIIIITLTVANNSSAQELVCQTPASFLKLHPKVYTINGGGGSYFKIYNTQKLEGLVDSAGKILLTPSYKYIGNISNGFVTVRLTNNTFQLVNLINGSKLSLPYKAVSPDIQDGTITVNNNGLPQLIDLKNNVLIPAGMYKSHSDAAEGLIPILKDGFYGYADYHGKVMIAPKYYYVDGFINGLGIVYAGSQNVQFEGLVNPEGKEVLPPVFKKIQYVDNNISAEDTSGKIALFKKDGSPLTKFIYDNIYDQSSDHYLVATRDHADFILDSNGKELFQSEYIGLSKDNGAGGPIKKGFLIANNYNSDGILKYGLLKYDGSIVLPLRYDFLDGFGDNELIMLPSGTEKYGTIDYLGKQMLAPKYDEVLIKTYKGYVVRIDDKIGVVNPAGKILVPFVYDSLADDKPLCLISLRKGNLTHYYDLNFIKK